MTHSIEHNAAFGIMYDHPSTSIHSPPTPLTHKKTKTVILIPANIRQNNNADKVARIQLDPFGANLHNPFETSSGLKRPNLPKSASSVRSQVDKQFINATRKVEIMISIDMEVAAPLSPAG